ncbi:hypothetical protein Q3G72_009546 [Acer saccharum]|nr:hypothetical protein Q3G72_009546 [Acer saccharum]
MVASKVFSEFANATASGKLSVTSEVVKEFLELYTSEGTVYAIKIRQAKANRGGVPKAYAINLRFIPANRNSSTSNNKEKEKA